MSLASANAVDRVLSNWDYWGIRHAAVDRWDHLMFAERVLPGWKIEVFLKRFDHAVMALRLDDALFVLPFTEPEDIRDGRRRSFDNAVTDSVSGTSAIAIADMLVTNALEVGTILPQRVALTVEAVILAAPADERTAIRTMMALRGIPQSTHHERLI